MAEPKAESAPASLSEAFARLPAADHTAIWDRLYQASVTPWDRQGPSLALADLVAQRPDLVPPPTPDRPLSALVPGCGPGHDVLLLRSLGYNVWGLDVSPDAIRRAEDNRRRRDEADPPPESAGSLAWIAADFFQQSWSQDIGSNRSGTFDLVFDYTFLCALPLELRPRWAKRMSELVAAPDGRLICLEYPSFKPLLEPGPPWPLRPEVYEALLSAPGDEIAYDDTGAVIPTPSPRPCPNALQRLTIIKPRRTHPAGTAEDDSVLDFISVWTH